MADSFWDGVPEYKAPTATPGAPAPAKASTPAAEPDYHIFDSPEEKAKAADHPTDWAKVRQNLPSSAANVIKNLPSLSWPPLPPSGADRPQLDAKGNYHITGPLEEITGLAKSLGHYMNPTDFQQRFEEDPLGAIIYPLGILHSMKQGVVSEAPKILEEAKKPGTPEMAAGAVGLTAAAANLISGNPWYAAGLAAGGLTGISKGLSKMRAAKAADAAAAAQAAAEAARNEFGYGPNTNPTPGSYKPMTTSAQRILNGGGMSPDINPQPVAMQTPGLPELPPGTPSPFKETVYVPPEGYRAPVTESPSAQRINAGQGTQDVTARPPMPGEKPLIGPIPESRATPPDNYQGPNQAPIAELVNGGVGISNVAQPPRLTPGLPPLGEADLAAAEAAYKPVDWGAEIAKREAASPATATPKLNTSAVPVDSPFGKLGPDGMPLVNGRPFSEANPVMQAVVRAELAKTAAKNALEAQVRQQVQQVFSQGKPDAVSPEARVVPNVPPPAEGGLTWSKAQVPEGYTPSPRRGRPYTPLVNAHAYDAATGTLHLDLRDGPIAVPDVHPIVYDKLKAAPNTHDFVRQEIFPMIEKSKRVPTQYEIIKKTLTGEGAD